jgi:uncharacterized protein YndB with AHSA1/START domain
MSDDQSKPVEVSRRIGAPAAAVFRILTDPRTHTSLDGSGMLRGAVSAELVSGVGDVFTMRMFNSQLGDYEMNNHVVEFVPDRRIGWEPAAGLGHPDASDDGADARWGQRWIFDLAPDGPDATVVTEIYDCSAVPAEAQAEMDGGRIWIEGMARTLERLEELCVRQDVR